METDQIRDNIKVSSFTASIKAKFGDVFISMTVRPADQDEPWDMDDMKQISSTVFREIVKDKNLALYITGKEDPVRIAEFEKITQKRYEIVMKKITKVNGEEQ